MSIAERTDVTPVIERLLAQRILILDGAMGTMIQGFRFDEEQFRGQAFADHPRDLKGCNDLLCITQPAAIEEIHRKYLALMQANFIESNPLPVKAVLAMMGKIEENYRLPLVPMKRDTRSRLQRIATDVGLIAKPAAPAPQAVEFYVYENWHAGPHKAVLHRSSCGQCNHGKGRPAGHDANHARWHGPYPSISDARQASQQMTGVLIRSECKCI